MIALALVQVAEVARLTHSDLLQYDVIVDYYR